MCLFIVDERKRALVLEIRISDINNNNNNLVHACARKTYKDLTKWEVNTLWSPITFEIANIPLLTTDNLHRTNGPEVHYRSSTINFKV
ncbi:unnamed protein product [Schistosoma curassoni]|uniref:Neur_chan_LBD domain-containing protein n=1 Tax=Schistosoma curassoni TaxID=6186 RepID=A0A183JY83_9TREM|nr:unnamed protein product [Schistosoma curassoni]